MLNLHLIGPFVYQRVEECWRVLEHPLMRIFVYIRSEASAALPPLAESHAY